MAAAITGILGFCAFIGGALLQFLGGIILETAKDIQHAAAYMLFFIPYCIYSAAAFLNLRSITESCLTGTE